MIVAIDGPAGAGKSSIAKSVAEKLNLFYLNSGNIYRAITYKVLMSKAEPRDAAAITTIAKKATIEIHNGRLYLDGEDIDDKLHTDMVDEWVSEHSAIVEVRHIVNDNLHKIAKIWLPF